MLTEVSSGFLSFAATGFAHYHSIWLAYRSDMTLCNIGHILTIRVKIESRGPGVRLLYRLMLSGLLLSGAVWAKHWHEDQDDWKWHWQHGLEDENGGHRHGKGCYFEPHDLHLIAAYYAQLHATSSVEEKKIHRNDQLPHGWETRMDLLPAALEHMLVPVPPGYRRGIIDGSAVVYNLQSGIAMDAVPLSAGL